MGRRKSRPWPFFFGRTGEEGAVQAGLTRGKKMPGISKMVSAVESPEAVTAEAVARRLKPQAMLVSREAKSSDTVVRAGSAVVGGGAFTVIAGPCSVENAEQMVCTARFAQKYGASIIRGGAYKPRTSPYSFQGLGEEGLELLAQARRLTGLPVVTEVMDTADVDLVESYADILQVGARNVQNFCLLKRVGQARKPVLLKRGLMTTIKEFLMAAEYILAGGNDQVILCERGIRTFETATRNTLDLSAVCVLKESTHLPVVVDPSHAVGNRRYVKPLARASLAVGADGIMVEMHCSPDNAMCDGDQSLTPADFKELMADINSMSALRSNWLAC
ncbi:MAG: 3-deoxy-7-phosphoheptulonate synthase [Desulfarculaceae bacterium]|nr:3-deoxy-7-phosphoheptulonate synthase [Desulfarculaceae bacterium]MCF8071659.1 3-deoxy-7-phosphoheptulonate synthase [Desulfarculaceae bacterium]MCF8102494.1 3-deoxy-7-phosphoheptulonate synthase [Desulfarculaceae bacterium]MCF8114938.1 3-deoxy-7-phosphoheptulonate synthase [Desulfarculaceae bacterium]